MKGRAEISKIENKKIEKKSMMLKVGLWKDLKKYDKLFDKLIMKKRGPNK